MPDITDPAFVRSMLAAPLREHLQRSILGALARQPSRLEAGVALELDSGSCLLHHGYGLRQPLYRVPGDIDLKLHIGKEDLPGGEHWQTEFAIERRITTAARQVRGALRDSFGELGLKVTSPEHPEEGPVLKEWSNYNQIRLSRHFGAEDIRSMFEGNPFLADALRHVPPEGVTSSTLLHLVPIAGMMAPEGMAAWQADRARTLAALPQDRYELAALKLARTLSNDDFRVTGLADLHMVGPLVRDDPEKLRLLTLVNLITFGDWDMERPRFDHLTESADTIARFQRESEGRLLIPSLKVSPKMAGMVIREAEALADLAFPPEKRSKSNPLGLTPEEQAFAKGVLGREHDYFAPAGPAQGIDAAPLLSRYPEIFSAHPQLKTSIEHHNAVRGAAGLSVNRWF